jgi:hypothetical protein
VTAPHLGPKTEVKDKTKRRRRIPFHDRLVASPSTNICVLFYFQITRNKIKKKKKQVWSAEYKEVKAKYTMFPYPAHN